MKKFLLSLLMFMVAVVVAMAVTPHRHQLLLQERAVKVADKTSKVKVIRKSTATQTEQSFENIRFTYASVSYMGKYETEDLFGDPVELGSYYLTLSTSKPDYLGYLADEGVQVDIIIYTPLPESDEMAVPEGTYLPAPLFEECEGTFDTLFPEMAVKTKTEGSDELTSKQFTFLEEGSIEIAASGTDGEYCVTLHDMVACNNDNEEEEVAVTGSYSGRVLLYNDDPTRCDILPTGNYEMSIPNMRSSAVTDDNRIKIEFYGTPVKSHSERPGYTEYPCGAGDFFSTILSLSASPYTDPDSFASTYTCGSSPYTYAGGLWNYMAVSGLGVPYGTYLAVYDDDVRPAYAFATQGTITVEKTETKGVYNFIIDVAAEDGTKMTGSWRGKLDGTPMPGENGIEDVVADQELPAEYFNLQGVRIAQPTSGIYIMRKGNAVTKIVK